MTSASRLGSKRIGSVLMASGLFLFSAQAASAETGNAEQNDPLETWNRYVFSFNDRADRYVLKPVAEGYRFITPALVNEGISNFFNNIGDVKTIGNSLLQGKLHNAVVALNRVIYNTSFGVLGLIDVSTEFGLRADDEDFGQTLGAWGWDESTYLMLPLLGPSTVRDLGGRFVDGWGESRLTDDVHKDTLIAAQVLKIVDKRADLLAAEHLLLDPDRYKFIRNAYLQNRDYLVNDGVVEDPFAEESFDDYEDF